MTAPLVPAVASSFVGRIDELAALRRWSGRAGAGRPGSPPSWSSAHRCTGSSSSRRSGRRPICTRRCWPPAACGRSRDARRPSWCATGSAGPAGCSCWTTASTCADRSRIWSTTSSYVALGALLRPDGRVLRDARLRTRQGHVFDNRAIYLFTIVDGRWASMRSMDMDHDNINAFWAAVGMPVVEPIPS